MNTYKVLASTLIVALLSVGTLVPFTLSYYVDGVSGSDSNAGTSSGSPTKTLIPLSTGFVPHAGIGYKTVAGPFSAAQYAYAVFYDSSEAHNTLTPFVLYMLMSSDGLQWARTAAVYTRPSGGILRDPSITRVAGVYYLAYTAYSSMGVVQPWEIASSPNMYDWSLLTAVPNSLGGTNNWAPEFFIDTDGSVHVFFANDSSGAFHIYETHPTDGTLLYWSAPVAVLAAGGGQWIDPYVVKVSGTYHLWGSAGGYIYHASCATVAGTYSVVGNPATGWGAGGYEAPSLIWTGSKWRMYVDTEPAGSTGIQYRESTDSWATWSALTTILGVGVVDHGTVISYHPPQAPTIGTTLDGAGKATGNVVVK
jgi:hypothetical protein